jgi:hypothetical protein
MARDGIPETGTGGTMTIIDELNAKIARAQASDRELARITGQTVGEMDADTTARDPTDTRRAWIVRRITSLQNSRDYADSERAAILTTEIDRLLDILGPRR